MVQPKVLGLIPARAGSKGIPRKNIAPVASHPLIAWSIMAAKQSKKLDRVIVSTDSKEIADVARKYDAEVPFLRPKEFARDESSSEEAAIHALGWLDENEEYIPDYLLYLQPTSPLRTAEDIDNSIQLAKDKNADAVLSVMPVNRHPYFMKTVDFEGRLRHFTKQQKPVPRRQELPPLYTLNGAIFLVRREILLKRQDWYGDSNQNGVSQT